MTEQTELNIKKLIAVPALITLAVTSLRLVGEFMNLPDWLANKEAGGPGALIGITWLAPVFGVYFAGKLADSPGKLWKNLLKTLFAYGLAARVPVILIMGFAIFGNWGTHYDAFPPNMADMSKVMQFLLGGVVTQLVVWVSVWTVGTGMLAGLIASRVRSPRPAAA